MHYLIPYQKQRGVRVSCRSGQLGSVTSVSGKLGEETQDLAFIRGDLEYGYLYYYKYCSNSIDSSSQCEEVRQTLSCESTDENRDNFSAVRGKH